MNYKVFNLWIILVIIFFEEYFILYVQKNLNDVTFSGKWYFLHVTTSITYLLPVLVLIVFRVIAYFCLNEIRFPAFQISGCGKHEIIVCFIIFNVDRFLVDSKLILKFYIKKLEFCLLRSPVPTSVLSTGSSCVYEYN